MDRQRVARQAPLAAGVLVALGDELLQADAAAPHDLHQVTHLREQVQRALKLVAFDHAVLGTLGGVVVAVDNQPGVLHALAAQYLLHAALVEHVFLVLATLDEVQRRLGDEDTRLLDEVGHLAEEEGEQQRADVTSVHVRVGHDDDLAVAQLAQVKVVLADAAVQRLNDRADLFEAQDLVEASFFDVEDFTLERQDGLGLVVAPALGAATGRVAFDQVDLGFFDVFAGAVVELAGQAAAVERAFAAG